MIDLQPQRGDDRVAIPFTFDSKYEANHLKRWKLIVSGVAMAILIAMWIIIMFIAEEDAYRWYASALVWVIIPAILRFAVIGEHRYRKDYVTLKNKNYTYDYSAFWNIYDTSTTAPTFFHHITGNNSIFVAFDKDVVVGKGDDSDFYHYDALSEAYNLLAKKEIHCVHIDYMDNVGKDIRLQNMMDDLNSCQAEKLKTYVYDIYAYMQSRMSTTFSDYDVYCFTSNERIDLMYDDLEPVLNAFMNANYIRYRVLDRQDVRELVESVMGLPDFSVTRSCDNLFASKGIGNFLKIIWTERDGKREIVNKTKDEILAEEKAAKEAKEARRHGTKQKQQVQQMPQRTTNVPQQPQRMPQQPVQRPQQPVQRPQQPVQAQQAVPLGASAHQVKQPVQRANVATQQPMQRPVGTPQQPAQQVRPQPAAVVQNTQQRVVPPTNKPSQKKPVKVAKQKDDAFAALNAQAAERERAKLQAPSTKNSQSLGLPSDDIIDLFSGDGDDENIDLFG